MTLQARRLTDEEVSEKFPKRSEMNLREYKALFHDLRPGEGYAVACNGVTVRSLKRRLGQAAKAILGKDVSLRYALDEDEGLLTFVVRPPAGTAAA